MVNLPSPDGDQLHHTIRFLICFGARYNLEERRGKRAPIYTPPVGTQLPGKIHGIHAESDLVGETEPAGSSAVCCGAYATRGRWR
jgi:hypothetical protein